MCKREFRAVCRVASSPGPFEKPEKRARYPLFAHALNFHTFQEFWIIPFHLRVLDVKRV